MSGHHDSKTRPTKKSRTRSSVCVPFGDRTRHLAAKLRRNLNRPTHDLVGRFLFAVGSDSRLVSRSQGLNAFGMHVMVTPISAERGPSTQLPLSRTSLGMAVAARICSLAPMNRVTTGKATIRENCLPQGYRGGGESCSSHRRNDRRKSVGSAFARHSMSDSATLTRGTL